MGLAEWRDSTTAYAESLPSLTMRHLLVSALLDWTCAPAHFEPVFCKNSTVLPSGSVTIAIVTPGRTSVTGTVGRMPFASSCAISPRISGTEIVK